MKAKRGPDIVVDTILGVQEPRICVDGLRVINDLKRLRSAPLVAFRTIAFDCPAEVRFARACARRVGPDKPTLEAFMHDDIGDAWSADPEEPNTLAVMNGADFHVDASKPIEEVMASIRAVVLDLC